MDHILYIDTWAVGNVFHQFGESLKRSLAGIGVSLHTVNALSETYAADMTQALNARNYEFAFSYLGVGKGSASGAVSLWDAAKLPFITIYGDSPSYFYDQHFDYGTWCVSLYVFEEHLKLRQMFSILRGFQGMVPTLPYRPVIEGTIDWKAKEQGKIVFLKNGNDPQKLREFWQRSLNPHVSAALMEISTAMAAHLDQCSHGEIVDRVLDFLKSAGLHDGAEKLMLLMTAQLDDYLRRVKSALVANILLDYPVEVHGVNWEHIDTAGRQGSLIMESDYVKSETLIRNALATFDMSPNTVAGVHDRLSRAAGHQTLCVTNSGQGLEQHFSNTGLWSYGFSEESLRERIEWMLGHRRDVIELGAAFAREFDTAYSIDQAYAQLKRMAGFVRQNNSTDEIDDAPPYFMWPPTAFVKSQAHRPVFIEEIQHWENRLSALEASVAQAPDPAASSVGKAGILRRMLAGR